MDMARWAASPTFNLPEVGASPTFNLLELRAGGLLVLELHLRGCTGEY